jgi:hypothetical protein
MLLVKDSVRALRLRYIRLSRCNQSSPLSFSKEAGSDRSCVLTLCDERLHPPARFDQRTSRPKLFTGHGYDVATGHAPRPRLARYGHAQHSHHLTSQVALPRLTVNWLQDNRAPAGPAAIAPPHHSLNGRSTAALLRSHVRRLPALARLALTNPTPTIRADVNRDRPS